MNIEFYVSMETIICLSILIFWFFLPIIIDLKKTMVVPENRRSVVWTTYALFVALPMILVNLILFLIACTLIKIVDLLLLITNWIKNKVGFDAKR